MDVVAANWIRPIIRHDPIEFITEALVISFSGNPMLITQNFLRKDVRENLIRVCT